MAFHNAPTHKRPTLSISRSSHEYATTATVALPSFRDRKYTTGSRTNRATKSGYWKATGKDRMVHEPATRAVVGMRKTLVFYRGRAPNGQKTSWVMHEFRLETPNSPPKEDWVLCRVFHKRKGEAEQGSNHGATTATATATATATGPSSPMALLGSSPDPTVVDKFDHHQIMSSSVFMSHRTDPSKQLMHHEGMMSSSTTTLLNLAMLQYEFLELPHGMAGGDEAMMELEQEMGYGEHVGFEEHGMGEIEMESYKDGLYF